MATSEEFRATAQAAIDVAPDVSTGATWLAEEYNSQDWGDDADAVASAYEEYTSLLKQKFVEQKQVNPAEMEESDLPISLDDVPEDESIEGEKNRAVDRIDRWKAANIDYFEVSEAQEDLEKKDRVVKYLPDIAEAKKRAITAPSDWTDTAARFALGVASPVVPTDTAQRFRERYTDTEYDDDFGSALLETGGGLYGIGAATAVNPGLGVAYMAAGAKKSVDAVVDATIKAGQAEGNSGLEQAVDVGQAVTLEMGAQMLMFKAASGLLKSGSKLKDLFTKATRSQAVEKAKLVGGSAVKAAVKQALKEGGATGVAMGASRAVTNLAYRAGLNTDQIPLTEGVATAAGAGAVFGAAVGGAVGAAEAIRSRPEVVAPEVSRGLEQAAKPDIVVEKSGVAAELVPETTPASESAPAPAPAPVPAELKSDAAIKDALASPKVVADTGTSEFAVNTDYAVAKDGTLEPVTVQTKALGGFDVDAIPETGVIKTADGRAFVEDAETGQLTAVNSETGNNTTYDLAVPVTKETAAHLYVLKNIKDPEGNTPVITTDGEKVYVQSEYVTPDLDISDTPTGSTLIEVPVAEANPGSVLLQVNKPQVMEGNQRVYASNLSAPISEVVPRIKVGEGTAERKFARTLLDDPNIPVEFKERISAVNPETGDVESIFRYTPETMEGFSAAGRKFIETSGGVEQAAHRLLTEDLPVSEVVNASNALQDIVYKMNGEVDAAFKTGDLERLAKLTDMRQQLADKLTLEYGTSLGQAIKGLDRKERDPDLKLGEFNIALFDQAVRQAARKQGVSLGDISTARQQIVELDKAIQAEQANPRGTTEPLTETEKAELAEVITAENSVVAVQQTNVDAATTRLQEQIQLRQSELDKINTEIQSRGAATVKNLATAESLEQQVTDSLIANYEEQQALQTEAIALGQAETSKAVAGVNEKLNNIALERESLTALVKQLKEDNLTRVAASIEALKAEVVAANESVHSIEANALERNRQLTANERTRISNKKLAIKKAEAKIASLSKERKETFKDSKEGKRIEQIGLQLDKLTKLEAALRKEQVSATATPVKALPPKKATRLQQLLAEQKKLEVQQQKAQAAVEKLTAIRDTQGTPTPKERNKIQVIREQLTQLNKKLVDVHSKESEQLTAADRNRLQKLRERRLVLESKGSKAGKAALTAEQAKKIDGLLRQKSALENRVQRVISEAQERVGRVLTPEEQEAYKAIVLERASTDKKSKTYEIYTGLLKRKEADLAKKLGGGWYNSAKVRDYYIHSLLAGFGTPATAAFQNILNGLLLGPALGVSRIPYIPEGHSPFRTMKAFYEYMFRGVPTGLQDAADTLRTGGLGRYTSDTGDFVETGPPVLRYIGYAGRAVGAVDALTFKPTADGYMAARLLDTPEAAGLRGAELRAYLDSVLFGNAESYAAAKEKVLASINNLKSHGVELSDAQVNKLIDYEVYAQRPEWLREEGERTSTSINLMREPDGFEGRIYNLIKAASENLFFNVPVPKVNSPWGRVPLKPLPWILMFSRSSLNMAALRVENTIGIGNLRAGVLENRSEYERAAIHAKAILGSSYAAVLALLAANGVISISGPGPRDEKRRQALLEQGHKFYTIGVAGSDVQWSYEDWPIAPSIAALGGYFDYQKYSGPNSPKPSKEVLANYVAMGVLHSAFSLPMLRPFERFYTGLAYSDNPMDALVQSFKDFSASVGGNFVPYKRMMRDLSAPFYDPINAQLDFKSALLANLPFVQPVGAKADLPALEVSGVKPALNIFGDPIRARDEKDTTDMLGFVTRFRSQKIKDPDIRFLAEKGYGVAKMKWRVELPDRAATRLSEERAAELGIKYADMFTRHEVYAIQEIAGPLLRRKIAQYRRLYGNRPYDKRIQKKIDRSVSKVYAYAKKKVLYSALDKYNPDVESTRADNIVVDDVDHAEIQ